MTAALDTVDAKDPIVQDYEEKRKRRYQGTPRNIIRHVILTDNKDLTINLPPVFDSSFSHFTSKNSNALCPIILDSLQDLSKEPILNYDPLPPPDAVNIYTFQREVASPGSQSRQGLVNMLVNSFLFDLNAGDGAQA